MQSVVHAYPRHSVPVDELRIDVNVELDKHMYGVNCTVLYINATALKNKSIGPLSSVPIHGHGKVHDSACIGKLLRITRPLLPHFSL
jgi:hypothetical protein